MQDTTKLAATDLTPTENPKHDLSQEKNAADTLCLDILKSFENGDFKAWNSKQKPYTGHIYNADNLFITGSVEDVQSITEVAGPYTNVVALNLMTGMDFVNTIEGWRLTCIDEMGTVIICLDNTEASFKKSLEILQELLKVGIKGITYNLCEEYKTPHEAAAADPAQFAHNIQQAQEKAKAARLPDDLDNFLKQIQTEAYKPHSTGIEFLDSLLSGGIINQTLTLLMAAPGTGKTTLAQQTAEAIAATGKPVVFLNLEMSSAQMLAKTISSRLAEKGKCTTDANGNPADYDALKILQGYTWTAKEKAEITTEIEDYRRSVFKNIQYNPEGINSDLDRIGEYLDKIGEDAKTAGTQAPVVILDYLHLVSNSRGLDAQELIKQAVTMLKHYAEGYNTAVICIVAVNRESMKKGQLSINSGRDSSNIEYTADYIVTLNYYDFDQGKRDPQKDSDLAALQQERYRRMILRLPKSRFGQPGRYVKVYYHAAANRFISSTSMIPDGAKYFDE